MEFTKVFQVKKEVDEKNFLRHVLVGLSKDPKSPTDILDAKFGKVSEFYSEILVLSADVEVNYSGSCGYDRQEEYTTTERKYLSTGDVYTIDGVQKKATTSGYAQVDVVKTRTVTDWQPHSGTIRTHKLFYDSNEDNADKKMIKLFPKAYKETKEENVIEEGSASVNYAVYQAIVKDCEHSAVSDVEWPGERHRDEHYTCKTDVKEIDCYIVPCYAVEFEYKGKKYRARGLAIGKANEVHDTPKATGNVETIEDVENRRKTSVAEKEKPLKFFKLFSVLAIIAGLTGLYGLINLKDGAPGVKVCLPVGFILMAVFIVIAVRIRSKVKRAVNEINAKAAAEKSQLNDIKINKLEKVLQSLNFTALSTAEKNEIRQAK